MHKDVSDEDPAWVRVRPTGLAVTGLPGQPKLESLLEDQPEYRWWPVYVRLLGDATVLGGLMEALGKQDVDAKNDKGPHE